MLRRKEGFVLRRFGETVLLVPVGPRVGELNGLVSLNRTGAHVWEALDGTRTVEEIAAGVVEKFEVDAERARRDVAEFCESLIEMGAVEHASPSE